jgi:hypothetical protein
MSEQHQIVERRRVCDDDHASLAVAILLGCLRTACSDGPKPADEIPLISLGRALVANSLFVEDTDAYDVRDRCPNQKFRLIVFQIGLQYLTTMDHHMKESFYD